MVKTLKEYISSFLCPCAGINISRMRGGFLFDFGRKVQLDSKMNWLDFDGQRLRSLVLVQKHVYPILVNAIPQELL